MKKIIKNIFAVSLMTLAIGIVFVIIGLSFGGFTSAHIDDKGIHFDDGKTYENKVNFKDITDMELNVDFDSVKIIESNFNQVKIIGKNNDKYKTTAVVNDKKLIISKKSGSKFNINILNINVDETKIIIYLKKGTQLNSLVINQNFGNINIKNIFANKLKIKNDCGSVNIKGIFDTVDIDNNFGDSNVTSGPLKNIEVENEFGDITINVKDNKDKYNIKQRNEFGDIYINGGDSIEPVTITGKSSIDTNFGTVKLNFNK